MKFLFPFALWLLLDARPVHGQAMVYALSGNQAAMATPLPSSPRIAQPTAYFTDANPGIEGQFGVPTDDTNHLFVYHLNHWRQFVLFTPQS